MPTMAEQAIRTRQTQRGLPAAMLAVELEQREKKTVERRICEAKASEGEDAGGIQLSQGAADLGRATA